MKGVLYFRCTAASDRFGPTDFPPPAVFGTEYLGLISWHPASQNTPPAADSGVGIGEFIATSRLASSSRSTLAISSSFSPASATFSFSPDNLPAEQSDRASSNTQTTASEHTRPRHGSHVP